MIGLVALVGFLCLGVGLALAAAGGGDSATPPAGDATTSGEAVSQDLPESEPPDTGDQNENDGDAADQQPPSDGSECDASTAANHGAYVSCVAQTAPKGSEHGEVVSAAAHTKRDDKHKAKGDDTEGNGGAESDGGSGHSSHDAGHGASSHGEKNDLGDNDAS